MNFGRECVLCSYRGAIFSVSRNAAPNVVESASQGVYTPWLQGCIPLRLGGVYPLASGVYTPSARGCIPLGLGGVHPPAARFYTEVAFVVIQPHYRSPKSRSLVQNRHEAESISSHKRGISANIESSTRKHPRFRPMFGRVGQIASLARLCQFAC